LDLDRRRTESSVEVQGVELRTRQIRDCGRKLSLRAAFGFRRQVAFVTFVGTHAEYDRIDALHSAILRRFPMEVRPIRSDKDHRAALAEIDAYWGAAEGTEEGDRLDVLLALVEIYEARRWPIDIDDNFDPIDVLGYV